MPLVLTVSEARSSESGLDALPFGPFAPEEHKTLELGLRQWVEKQTRLKLGYVEQLYTFGDQGRLDAGQRSISHQHLVSIGYLALVRRPSNPTEFEQQNLSWNPWYRHFPWEDWRQGEPRGLTDIVKNMEEWALAGQNASQSGDKPDRMSRLMLAFAFRNSKDQPVDHDAWDEERVLERYELMYEAGLVEEAVADGHIGETKMSPSPGIPMAHDHRRILATAMARLRAKLKYRPIIFELLEENFTLTELQQTVEMLSGRLLHKQNFRRMVENAKLVEPTGATSSQTGGRPAAYFRFRRSIQRERPAPGFRLGTTL